MFIKLFILIVAVIVLFLSGRRCYRIYGDVFKYRRPEFFIRDVAEDDLGIPVFTYHSIANENTSDSVKASAFYKHLEYLTDNGYETLSADQFYQHIVNNMPVPKRSVVITFDDGRASLWTNAFPIIQKFGVKVICFLTPQAMMGQGTRSCINLDDISSIDQDHSVLDVDLSKNPLVTWEETQKMYSSGLVDFQSHTYSHKKIFISNKIVDFINPDFNCGTIGNQLPLLNNGEVDPLNIEAFWGMPVFESDSRMGAARRYFENEKLMDACITYAAKRNGKNFFKGSDWRDELLAFCTGFQRQNPRSDRFESESEQREAIRRNLVLSKRRIENYLPNHTVKHICFPWHRYSSLALSIAREVGFVSGWIDINSQDSMNHKANNPYLIDRYIPRNSYGTDPFFISRIDAREDVVMSLPGRNRLSLIQRFSREFFRLPGFLVDKR